MPRENSNTRRSPSVGTPQSTKGDAKPKHGRRASRGAAAAGVSAFEEGTGARGGPRNDGVQDAVPQNVRVVEDEETGATAAASAELLARRRAEKEKLSQAVSDAPTGYQAQMPHLSDLDIKNDWDRLLQTIHGEFDMSCLTACLARELDEDVAWNPEMLLVQLTSDLNDAAALRGGDGGDGAAATLPVDESEIGLLQGGEAVRKRREKGSADESPHIPPAGGQRGTAASPRKAGAAAPAPAGGRENAAMKRRQNNGSTGPISNTEKGTPSPRAKVGAASPGSARQKAAGKSPAAGSTASPKKDSTAQQRKPREGGVGRDRPEL